MEKNVAIIVRATKNYRHEKAIALWCTANGIQHVSPMQIAQPLHDEQTGGSPRHRSSPRGECYLNSLCFFIERQLDKDEDVFNRAVKKRVEEMRPPAPFLVTSYDPSDDAYFEEAFDYVHIDRDYTSRIDPNDPDEYLFHPVTGVLDYAMLARCMKPRHRRPIDPRTLNEKMQLENRILRRMDSETMILIRHGVMQLQEAGISPRERAYRTSSGMDLRESN